MNDSNTQIILALIATIVPTLTITAAWFDSKRKVAEVQKAVDTDQVVNGAIIEALKGEIRRLNATIASPEPTVPTPITTASLPDITMSSKGSIVVAIPSSPPAANTTPVAPLDPTVTLAANTGTVTVSGTSKAVTPEMIEAARRHQ